MKIRPEDIIIKKRIRKDMGDIESLMESIQKHGIMNPIVINKKNELIAGHRRLESCIRLGMRMVPVKVVDSESRIDMLELEIEENVQRQNLTTEELADAYMLLDKLRNPGFFRRIWNMIVRFFKWIFGRS
jgi:ParB family chromosome partitioning protein